MSTLKLQKRLKGGRRLRPLMFLGLPEGTLGEVVELTPEKTNLHGQIVMVKSFFGAINLQDQGIHRDLEDGSFEIRVLPKGTVITLTQE
jgi:hypothetical protein